MIFLYFIIYAFFGWTYETLLCSILQKSFVNRGFLNGPLCPVYGFGSLLVIYSLGSVSGNLYLLFLGSAVLTTVLEYITSFLLEKLFATKWWDYSHLKYNLNGRVCVAGSLVFGLLSVLLIRLFHPAVKRLIDEIPKTYLLPLCLVLFILILTDLIVTVSTVVSFNGKLAVIYKALVQQKKQLAEELKAVSGRLESGRLLFIQITKHLSGRQLQITRLMRAFPKMQSVKYQEIFYKFQELAARGELKLPLKHIRAKKAKDADLPGEEKIN